MLSGRLRRRALALLGALLLVILIWPPCCATMPKPLPAVLPTVPQIDLDPIPAVAIVVQNQNNKSRKVSDLSRFINVLLMRPVDSGESGPRAVSTHHDDDDDSQRTLNLPRRENSSAGHPIESSIDKNKSNEQQTTVAAVTKRLDNDVTTFGGSDPAVESGSTYQPTNIFSILSQRTSAAAATPPSGGVDLQVNDRDGGGVVVTAVNQSVFNPTSNSPTSSSSTPRRHHPFFPVLSRAERSADGPHHPHRHQHHYQTGEGTLAASGRRLRHQSHRNGTTPMTGGGGPDAGGSDTSNLERNERSANLSHITGANRKIQLYIKNRYLQLLADGTVNGTHDDQSEFKAGMVNPGKIQTNHPTPDLQRHFNAAIQKAGDCFDTFSKREKTFFKRLNLDCRTRLRFNKVQDGTGSVRCRPSGYRRTSTAISKSELHHVETNTFLSI